MGFAFSYFVPRLHLFNPPIHNINHRVSCVLLIFLFLSTFDRIVFLRALPLYSSLSLSICIHFPVYWDLILIFNYDVKKYNWFNLILLLGSVDTFCFCSNKFYLPDTCVALYRHKGHMINCLILTTLLLKVSSYWKVHKALFLLFSS